MWPSSEPELLRTVTSDAFNNYPFGPLAVVYFVFLLIALIFRPETIRRTWAFRLSLACFVFFLLTPCVAELEVLILGMSNGKNTAMARIAEKRLEGKPFIDFMEQCWIVLSVLFGLVCFSRKAISTKALGK